MNNSKNKIRCDWVGIDPIYIDYHDKEWGVPLYNDQKLFELLCLEGAQAGLSWITILKRRDNYRLAFDNFDPIKISKYTNVNIEKLLQNDGIIRNRLKINSFITNAKLFQDVQKEHKTFSKYIWSYVNNKPIINKIINDKDYPVKTDLAETISKDLKKKGFKFVGPTIIYAYMQSAGLTNDHQVTCFRYNELKQGVSL